MRIPLLFGVAVLATSCSSGPRLTQSFRAGGVSIRYPHGWDATKQPLTPVTDPTQFLAVGSYRLPRNDKGADGCMPKEALDRLPPDGAFLFGWEFRMPSPSGLQPADFPRRPDHFRLSRVTESDCLGRSYALRFSDAGRFFQVHVALGRHAGSTMRGTVVRILDSLRAQSR